MTDEVKEYFEKKYNEASFMIVPGHNPNFKTKDEVDKWFELMESMVNEADDEENIDE